MDNHDRLAFLILDGEWRPCGHLPIMTDWAATIRHLLAAEAHWVALHQYRLVPGEPVPDHADIALTRSIRRRLSLLDILLADHLIQTPTGTFSFRTAGLL